MIVISLTRSYYGKKYMEELKMNWSRHDLNF